LNDHSAVIKLTYDDTSFIFMGDADSLSEGHITADVSANVLKISHHGSRTSTSESFLNRVSPKYAVISVGSGNSYGHPHDEVLARLDNAGISVFRTDLQGTIVFTSDGNIITVDTAPMPYQPHAPPSNTGSSSDSSNGNLSTALDSSQSSDMTVYITNTGERYHLDGCSSLSRSKIETTISIAKSRGLTACGRCKPPS
jgi:competence protein ComEC